MVLVDGAAPAGRRPRAGRHRRRGRRPARGRAAASPSASSTPAAARPASRSAAATWPVAEMALTRLEAGGERQLSLALRAEATAPDPPDLILVATSAGDPALAAAVAQARGLGRAGGGRALRARRRGGGRPRRWPEPTSPSSAAPTTSSPPSARPTPVRASPREGPAAATALALAVLAVAWAGLYEGVRWPHLAGLCAVAALPAIAASYDAGACAPGGRGRRRGRADSCSRWRCGTRCGTTSRFDGDGLARRARGAARRPAHGVERRPAGLVRGAPRARRAARPGARGARRHHRLADPRAPAAGRGPGGAGGRPRLPLDRRAARARARSRAPSRSPRWPRCSPWPPGRAAAGSGPRAGPSAPLALGGVAVVLGAGLGAGPGQGRRRLVGLEGLGGRRRRGPARRPPSTSASATGRSTGPPRRGSR